MARDERFLDKVYSVKTDAETRALYDRWAEVYDEELAENAYSQPKRSAEALSRLVDPAEAAVLDIGCGSGLSGIALNVVGFTTIDGCDFSPGMLEKAAKTRAYRRLFETNLNKPPMDAADSSYDAAACVGVFSFGHIQADALDDIFRVLKPGGVLVIGVNTHYYEEGFLTGKLSALEAAGGAKTLLQEHGEHIPGTGMTGWVICARKL